MTNFKKTLAKSVQPCGPSAVLQQALRRLILPLRATRLGVQQLRVDGSIVADDNVDLDGFNLIVNDSDQTAIGDITDGNATPDGNVIVTSDSDGVDIDLTIGSVTTGTGNLLVTTLDADNANCRAFVE